MHAYAPSALSALPACYHLTLSLLPLSPCTYRLLVRSEFDTKSAKLGEIAVGTLVFVLETKETADGSIRMKFAFATPSGGMSEGGWVTSITKDGTENVKEAIKRRQINADGSVAGGSEALDAKALASIVNAQKAKKSGGGKGETAAAVAAAVKAVASSLGAKAAAGGAGAAAAAIQQMMASQQAKKGDAAKGGKDEAKDSKGNMSARGKDGGKSPKDPITPKGSKSPKDPITPKGGAKSPGGSTSHNGGGAGGPQSVKDALGVDYDKLREALEKKNKDAAEKIKNIISTKTLTEETQKLNRYTRNEAHRPSGRSDEMPSRHLLCTTPASCILMFNCNRCSFELQQGDLTTLPESEALDLKSMLNQTTIGRVKIAPEKGTLFIDRVEFPNEWKVGDEHGLIHDGLQVYAAAHARTHTIPSSSHAYRPPLTPSSLSLSSDTAGRRQAHGPLRMEVRGGEWPRRSARGIDTCEPLVGVWLCGGREDDDAESDGHLRQMLYGTADIARRFGCRPCRRCHGRIYCRPYTSNRRPYYQPTP